MNHYRHMMEQVTLSDRKKEEMMEQLEHKQSRKRRIPTAGRVVLVAAITAVCLLSVAAATSAPDRVVYRFATGGEVTQGDEHSGVVSTQENAPVILEDGRLWFVADGKKVDITDLVDEDTPYIYERTDPATGEKGWVVVGGTPAAFGWAEYARMDDGWAWSASEIARDLLFHVDDGRVVSFNGIGYAELEDIDKNHDYTTEEVYPAWHQAARDMLGVEKPTPAQQIDNGNPVILKDGRLWLDRDGQLEDITDLIDENTPYIYERTDPATGVKSWMVAGGSPDNFGWVEYKLGGYDYGWAGGNCSDMLITVDDGRVLTLNGIDPDEWEEINAGHDYTMENIFPGWHQAAREELGFTEH